jgi:hypothetical protein
MHIDRNRVPVIRLLEIQIMSQNEILARNRQSAHCIALFIKRYDRRTLLPLQCDDLRFFDLTESLGTTVSSKLRIFVGFFALKHRLARFFVDLLVIGSKHLQRACQPRS